MKIDLTELVTSGEFTEDDIRRLMKYDPEESKRTRRRIQNMELLTDKDWRFRVK